MVAGRQTSRERSSISQGESKITKANEVTTGARIAGWSQGLTLAAQAVLPTMGIMLLVPVVPMIFAQYGSVPKADYWIPAMLTVPALCIAIFSPFVGLLADRIGRRTPLIIALSIYAFAGLAPLLLTDFAAIFATRVALGICEAFIITLSATLIGDYFTGKLRDRLLALISTIASLSAIVFIGVSGVLGQAFGWRGPIAVYGLSLLFVPLMLWLTWDTRQQVAAGPKAANPAGNDRFPWRHAIISGATTLFGSTLFYVLAVQFALALSALGVNEPQRIGMLGGIASIGTPIGTLVFWRVWQWRVAGLLSIGFTLIGLACIAVGNAQTDLQATIAAFVGLLGCGLLFPTMLTWTMRRLSFHFRGRGTGIFQSMFALGQFASALAIPFLTRNVTGSVLGSFSFLGAATLAAAAVTMLLAIKFGPSTAQLEQR
jgi:MFS family permease